MGRELMRTPAQGVGAHDLSNAPPEPALDEPAASAPIARGGMAALRDPRVRGAIGNRAVGRVLSRQPAPPPTEVSDPDAIMIDVEGRVLRFEVGKQIEYCDAFPVPGAKASRLATASAP